MRTLTLYSLKSAEEKYGMVTIFHLGKGGGRGRMVLPGVGGILVFKGNGKGISRRRQTLKVGPKLKIDLKID